jgi:Flp pilus assembly protein TadG
MFRRGNTAVQVALMLTMLLGFAAVGVDLSVKRYNERQALNAAEAAAHAAAAQLDGTSTGVTNARLLAVQLAASNPFAGSPANVDANTSNDPAGNVVLGRVDETGAFVADATPETATAVRVQVARTDLPTYFAKAAFDVSHMSAGGTAIAVAGGPSSSDCPIPIAVPACQLDAAADICNLDIVFNSDGKDNAGWALPGTARPDANSLANAVQDCMGQVDTVDVVSLNNGTVTNALHAMASEVSASTDYWNTAEWGKIPNRSTRSGITAANYGKVLLTELMVYDDPNGCADPSYNATGVPVRGFATAAIYDVETSGPVSNRNIRMRVFCAESDNHGGGGFYGTDAPPRFVTP